MILTEVLQGFRYDKDYLIARELLESLTFYRLSGQDIAIKSVENLRFLRKKGLP